MVVGRLWLVALLGMGAVLLAACSDPLEDAIARAEADGATPGRVERGAIIDALRGALAEPGASGPEIEATANAWLGRLLVRHGRHEEARDVLAGFDASVDGLIEAEQTAAVVRGLTAYGTTLWLAGVDFEAPAPVDRAIAIARDHLAGNDPLLVAALLQRARIHITFREGDEAAILLEEIGTLVPNRAGDPEIILAHALLLQGPLNDVRTKGAALDETIADYVGLLEAASRLFADDHPQRMLAMRLRGEVHARRCELDAVDTLFEEAVAFSKVIYGPRSNTTFQVIEEYGMTLMSVGLTIRGQQMIRDARAWRYGASAKGLAEPDIVLFDVPCVDPPQ